MQTNQTMQTKERSYNFVGIRQTLDIIPKLEPHNIDAKDEVIAELASAMKKIMNLRDRSYLFDPKATSFLATKGETEMLKFCLEELGCPGHKDAYSRAAERGELECMELLETHDHDPMDALYRAVAAGELEAVRCILKYHTHVPDMYRLAEAQDRGGFPEIKAYLTSVLGDF
jgi:hypothetical protein